MKTPTIFISYNPDVSFEETLAIRLQTIGAVNGFRAYLPDRYYSNTEIDRETIARINESDYFVIFATRALSRIVEQEIEVAAKAMPSSHIMVIYNDEEYASTHATDGQFNEIFFSPSEEGVDQVIHRIIKKLQGKESKKKQNRAIENGVAALLGIGLGLLVLGGVAAYFDRAQDE